MSLKIKFEPASVAPRTHISQAYLCTSRISQECDVHVEASRADHIKANNLRMICHKCGDALATLESKRKASMVQIPYSKGAYQYIHNPDELRFTNPKRTT